jgi:rSAM/selenodomain-associated transferase 2
MRVSVIIPVYDEGAMLRKTVDHLFAMEGARPFEIIVVDGHPEQTTLQAMERGCVTGIPSAKGRGCQMNRGAAAASGDTLLFLHADTLLPPRAFDHIRYVLGSERGRCGAFDLGIASEGWAFRLIEAMVYLRTRLTRIPYGDQAFFFEKGFFFDVGGFSDIPIMEDVDLMRRVRAQGEKIAIAPTRVATSPRRWRGEGIVCCTLRNWSLMVMYLAGIPPEKLARHYATWGERRGTKTEG